ncbi:leucine-rich repeat-containing protein 25 [Tyto alba]|uniref:leucine-rich repeat-containing protein 25 n=1 Tax=Tyto alba TaxID=56313 RepID=UPI001C67511A|nr:leucine-rich repeat-containing protein 25 [Tyto alba]
MGTDAETGMRGVDMEGGGGWGGGREDGGHGGTRTRRGLATPWQGDTGQRDPPVPLPAPPPAPGREAAGAQAPGGAMECPVTPLLLLLLLLLLRPAAPAAPCVAVPPAAPAELDLSNSTQQCAELDWGPFQHQKRLWLSRNGIAALSPSSRVGPGLEELDLSYNRLRELPVAFFANATALQSLRLEGNPLPAVPPTAFQASLRFLAVPCRCDVVGDVLAPCSCSRPECAARRCRCLTDHRDDFNVTDFHARECQGNVGLVGGLAGAAGAVAVVLVVVAVVCYRRRKAATAVAGTGLGKRESTMGHGQPRYISRATEIGTTEIGTDDATAAAPDYENIFVTPRAAPAAARGWTPGWQEERYSPQVPVDDDYFLESEATPRDQPIYANTQSSSEDNVYIIPNQ